MKYYKWMNTDKDEITMIPGFAFGSLADAIEMEDEVRSWIESDNLNLYEFEGPNPIDTHLMFRSSMIYFRKYEPLSKEGLKYAIEYFNDKPYDYFGLAISDTDTITIDGTKITSTQLFNRLLKTIPAMHSTVDSWGYKVTEYIVSVSCKMKKINNIVGL